MIKNQKVSSRDIKLLVSHEEAFFSSILYENLLIFVVKSVCVKVKEVNKKLSYTYAWEILSLSKLSQVGKNHINQTYALQSSFRGIRQMILW